jgi:deazaflavin-dependent oxidoreductase (nitroreductase family)
MPLEGEYEPSPFPWVRDQVAEYEASGGARGNLQRETGLPVIIVAARGRRTGKIRKWPLMRVEHNGEYALVASKGGTPENPLWYGNLVANPTEVTIQDGPEPFDVEVREVHDQERELWWQRAVAAFPNYAGYTTKTERVFPILVATRR